MYTYVLYVTLAGNRREESMLLSDSQFTAIINLVQVLGLAWLGVRQQHIKQGVDDSSAKLDEIKNGK